jgi:hypothetical protein
MRQTKSIIFTLSISLIAYQCSIGQSFRKLGGTHYYLQLPHIYEIQESHGIDYTIFRFSNAASARSDSSDAFIMFGCCVGTIGGSLKNVKGTDSLSHSLLNTTALWHIYNCDSLYLAETLVTINEEQKAVLGIKSKSRKEIDSLIASFGSLRKK